MNTQAEYIRRLMDELEQIQALRQQALNVFGFAHKDDPEMIEFAKETQALHESISQPLKLIKKKERIILHNAQEVCYI